MGSNIRGSQGFWLEPGISRREGKRVGRHWRVAVNRVAGGRAFCFSDKKFEGSTQALEAARAFAKSLSYDLMCEYVSLKRRINLRSASKSGITGVTRISRKTDGGDYWTAYWTDSAGRRHARKFSVERYGELVAQDLAITTRSRAVEQDFERLLRLEAEIKAREASTGAAE